MDRPRAARVRQLFEAVDRSIETGSWTEPAFDELLRQLEEAIAEAYGAEPLSAVAPPQ
jgi:recombinational DNA repair protein (RecF pathway)